MLRLVNLSSVAMALIFIGVPRAFTQSGDPGKAPPYPSEIALATITDSVPSAIITTESASGPGKDLVPSYLLIKPRRKHSHNGDAIRDVNEKVLTPIAYGYSQIFDYTVLDQKGRPFRRRGMTAREEITLVGGNVDQGENLPAGSVPIDEEGRFADLQALFTESYPPLPAGSFLKFKQKVIVSYKNQDYLLGIVCIEQRLEEVILTAYARTDASCK